MKFEKWIDEEGIKLDKIAEKLDVSRMAIYNIIRKRNLPSLDLALKIEKLTKGKVKCKDWIDESNEQND